MSNSTNYLFEAKQNANGDYVCETFTESYHESAEQTTTAQKNSDVDGGVDIGNSGYQASDNRANYGGFGATEDLFSRSYQNNIYSNNADYIDNMRQQFEQMRRSMLDQMESFTLIRNIKM